MNDNKIAAYLLKRDVINVDSFYRCRSLGINDRNEAVDLLRSLGYVFEDVRIAYRPGSDNIPTNPYDRFRSMHTEPIDLTYATPPEDQIDIIVPKSIKPSQRKIVLTSYLLKTKVNQVFFKNLIYYCGLIDAQLIVLVHRYHNPTNNEQAENQNDTLWIDPIVEPYLCWERFEHGDFTVFADVRINPTNLNPLNALRSTWRKHSIYGHTTQTLTTGNNSVNQMSPIAWCTGTISEMQVADNLTAKKAEYHQRYGFLICDGDSVRNVHARRVDGSFTDMNTTVYQDNNIPRSIYTKPTNMVWGDLHFGNHDPIALDWAIEMTCQLNPNQIVFNDMFDGSSINPHTDDRVELGSVYRSLGEEVAHNKTLLLYISNKLRSRGCNAELAVAESNHHQFIDRYFKNKEVKKLDRGEREILAQWLDGGFSKIFPTLKHLSFDYTSQGIRLGNHGHKGANGAKGSLMGDFQAGLRQIAGHTHIPGILGGSERVGCLCKLQQGYNQNSLSGWAQSIAIVQPGSKIQHLIRFD